jgi:transposase-like protein
MVERSTNRIRIELCPDNRRDAATLVPIIERHVHPGTMIYSDGWAAYRGLQEAGYQHQTVIHDRNFVDPDTGTHTQTIEGMCERVGGRGRITYL